jgi:hypothetical protein
MLSIGYKSDDYYDYHGSLRHGFGSIKVINNVHCPKCFILFLPKVLGPFILIEDAPYWKSVTTEKCDKCSNFRHIHHAASRDNDFEKWDEYSCREKYHHPIKNGGPCMLWEKNKR